MSRLTEEQLDKIKNKYNVNKIWSFSRINKFKTSPYDYFLTYVKHIPSDRNDSIYVFTGNLGHEILDKLYENKINYEDMINEFEDGWIVFKEVSKLKFDRTDEIRDNSIAEKYKIDLQHFFTHHTMYKNKLNIEKPVVINVNNNIFVGYMDAQYLDDDGIYHIVDFKTSSIYKGNTLIEHSAQLILYAIGFSQMYNIPLDKIKINFNFLKYCDIQYEQANGSIKTRQVERCKIGESLQTNLKVWIKKFGYENKMDDMLKEVLDSNSIDSLPDEIKSKYVISDCYVYVPITEKTVNDLIDDITLTIKDIELREKDYAETKSDACFWDSEDNLKVQSYYLSNLCSYSPNLHKPYKAYLDKQEAIKNGQNMFDGIGSDVSISYGNKINSSNSEELDLSWIDQL